MEIEFNIGRYLMVQKALTELYVKLCSAAALRHGLKMQEADVLLFFANNPSLDTSADAVEYRRFSKAYVSKALSVLIEMGYVRLDTDRADRRYQHVVILPKASPAVDDLKGAQHEFTRIISNGVSKQTWDDIAQTMDIFLKNATDFLAQAAN